jgi:hypothetical protein
MRKGGHTKSLLNWPLVLANLRQNLMTVDKKKKMMIVWPNVVVKNLSCME